jgi:hypothetical protein
MSAATPELATTHAVQESSQPVPATAEESPPINTEAAISTTSSPPLTEAESQEANTTDSAPIHSTGTGTNGVAVAEPAQPEAVSTDAFDKAAIPTELVPTEEKVSPVMTTTELTHVAPEATQLTQSATTPFTSETHLPEHAEEAEEPQNDLTQKFTDLEWKALKRLRVSIYLCVVFFQKRAC